MFKPVKSQKLYLQVVDQIKALIDEGSLQPGDVLPSVEELALSIGVGRSTVREAMVVLETIGCIEKIRGKGSVITSSRIESGSAADPVALLQRFRNTFDAVQEFNAIHEPAIAKLAAEKATDDDILELEKVMAKGKSLLEKRDNLVEASENSLEFHRVLTQITKNPFFMNLFEVTKKVERENRNIILRTPHRIRESWEEHMQVLDAVREGDGDRAYEAMLRHVLKVGETFSDIL